MAFGLQRIDEVNAREDLADVIADVSPDDNPLMTMLSTTKATNWLHEWPEDYSARPTSVSAANEGAAATYSDLTQPARRSNRVMTVMKTFRVSGIESQHNVAGMGDPYDYQKAKALKEWKMQAEYNLIQSDLSAAVSGYPQAMAGIEAIVTSHFTARLSGTSLSETEFNSMVYDVANDVGSGDVADLVLTTLKLKQKISTFTAGSTRYVDAADKRLTRPVQVYESDFGVHRILGHKDVTSAAATPGPRVLLLNEKSWKVAYMRKPFAEELAKDGDRRNGMIVGDFTLEFGAERSNAQRTGYNQNG